MLKQLVVVDYQEGAGGEFLASFISAHWGHALACNPQIQNNVVQKWLNTHSLVRTNWHRDFDFNLKEFFLLCEQHCIDCLAVPYHLYKWPHHVQIILKALPNTRFVRVAVGEYLDQISTDFQRKVQQRILGPKDFGEIKFFLEHQDKQRQQHCWSLFKQGQLTLSQLRPDFEYEAVVKHLPSQDIEIHYGDFFVNFDRTAAAYQTLCQKLGIANNQYLLQQLIQRNQENLQAQKEYLSTL